MRIFIGFLISFIFLSLNIIGEVAYADDDINVTIRELTLEKERLLAKANEYASIFKKDLPKQRTHWKKKIKHNPTAQHNSRTGLYVIKKVKFLEKKIKKLEDLREKINSLQPAGRSPKTLAVSSQIIKKINDSIQRCEEKSLEKMRCAYAPRRKKRWDFAFLAFCLFTAPWLMPAVPVAADVPVQSSFQPGHFWGNEFQCFNSSLNGTGEGISSFKASTSLAVPSAPSPSPLMSPKSSSFMAISSNELQKSNNLTKEAHELSTVFRSILTCLNSSGAEKRYCIQTSRVDYSAEQISSFYKNIKPIGGGGNHNIYEATLTQNRETSMHDQEEVNAGTKIALRVKLPALRTEHRVIPPAIDAYSKIELLTSSKISNYIPFYYGFYYGPYIPEVEGSYLSPDDTTVYTEMELMDTTYEKEYRRKKNSSTARVICEELVGKWALQKVAKIFIGDDKVKQYGLKWDEDYLAYHIGSKTYLFEPGYSPRRLDIDNFYMLSEKEVRAPFRWEEINDFLYKRAPSQNLKKLYEEINTKGLFSSIYENLKEFEVTEQNPIPHTGVRHLYIPEDLMNL